MADLSPILAELERLYRALVAPDAPFAALSKSLGATNVPAPVITVSSKGRKRNVLGWYVPAVWGDSGEDTLNALAGGPTNQAPLKRAELVLASELLSDPLRTVAELARLMLVHAGLASIHGNNYYPQGWDYWAVRIGCRAYVLPDQPSKGWAGLEVRQTFKDAVGPMIDYSVFQVERDNDTPAAKVGSRMHKWQCSCTVIRSATEVQAFCTACKAPFTWAEPVENLPTNKAWARQLAAKLSEAAATEPQEGGAQ